MSLRRLQAALMTYRLGAEIYGRQFTKLQSKLQSKLYLEPQQNY